MLYSTLLSVNVYTIKVESLIEFSSTFQNSDPRYSHILNLTLTDLDSILDEITATQDEASNLIDHIHNSQNKRNKDHSYHLVGYLISYLTLQMMIM